VSWLHVDSEKYYTRWEDNIKVDHREMECGFVKLIQLLQNKVQCQAFMNTAAKLSVL